MHKRILAGLGAAALATAGFAAPANALSSTTADVWVVHGAPGLTVDVYLNGGLTIEDFAPGDVRPIVDAAPATYTIDLVVATPGASPATITAGTGDVTGSAVVAAGISYSVVAHYGVPTGSDPAPAILSVFENDLSAAGAGNASVTVRHTANAPAVNVVALPSTTLFSGVENGDQGTVNVPAASYDVQVQVAGSDPVVVAIDRPGLQFNAGTHYFIHAVGDGTGAYNTVVFTIGDTPAGVPAGSAGLVAENGAGGTALIAGAAALLALMVAAGLVIARRSASVER